jgi:hypothetical protein
LFKKNQQHPSISKADLTNNYSRNPILASLRLCEKQNISREGAKAQSFTNNTSRIQILASLRLCEKQNISREGAKAQSFTENTSRNQFLASWRLGEKKRFHAKAQRRKVLQITLHAINSWRLSVLARKKDFTQRRKGAKFHRKHFTQSNLCVLAS